jgi:hypothetical protein
LTFEQFANLIEMNVKSKLEARLQQMFDTFGADQSGEISLEKFTAYIRRLDSLVTTAEAAAMFKDCDRDGNGSVSMQDFMRTIQRSSEMTAATQCRIPQGAQTHTLSPTRPNLEFRLGAAVNRLVYRLLRVSANEISYLMQTSPALQIERYI